MVTVFAAIGGTLLAGTQFSNLGQVVDPVRLGVALGSAAIALFAVGWVIWEVSHVLALEDPVDLDELLAEEEDSGQARENVTIDIKYIRDHPRLLDDYSTIKELEEANQRITAERDKLVKQQEDFRAVEQRKLYLDKLIYRLLYTVRYERARRQYKHAVECMLFGGAVIAVCIVIFAWAANPPA